MSAKISILSRLVLLAPWLTAPALAQADQLAHPQVLRELQSIRQALERIEQNQRALLSLARLQADQNQLAALEAERPRLAARETELSRQTAGDRRSLAAPAALLRTPEGETEAAPHADDGPLRERLAAAEASLNETRARRLSVDEEIARLKARVAAAEKLLDERLPPLPAGP